MTYRTIKQWKMSDILKLNILFPEIQRILDKDVVNDIVNYQLEFRKNHGRFNFIGVINIHYVKERDTYFLVDGQHRFTSGRRLYDEHGHDVELFIEIVYVNTMLELKSNYANINKNTPLPNFPDTIDKSIIKETLTYFETKYERYSIWSKSSKARRPHVYKNFFQEGLCYIAHKLKDRITSANELINALETFNTKIGYWNKEAVMLHTKCNEKMYCTAKVWNFYLGLYIHTNNEDYGYDWERFIIEDKTGILVKPKKKIGRASLSKALRDKSWDTHIGSDWGNVYCIVCRHSLINQKHFEAGHIISRKNGGTDTIDNILPICSLCNKSMGATNMNEFIFNNFPNHINDFRTKTYKKVISTTL